MTRPPAGKFTTPSMTVPPSAVADFATSMSLTTTVTSSVSVVSCGGPVCSSPLSGLSGTNGVPVATTVLVVVVVSVVAQV